MTQIAAAARNLRKGRGEFVYMPGDQADSVYVLKKGRIKLSLLSESGKEIAIDIIQPGEMLAQRKPARLRKAISYVCPMHLDIRSKARGTCPKCLMDLVAEGRDPKSARH